MKKTLLLLIAFLVIQFLSAQSALDSLRMVVPIGHTSFAKSAKFSPDGRLAMTLGDDNIARIYEVASGKQVQLLKGHRAQIFSADFSPNGKLVITSSMDSTSRIWDVLTGMQIHLLEGCNDWVKDAKFSNDGNFVINSNIDSALVYNVSNKKLIQILDGYIDGIGTAAFSSDDKFILTTGIYEFNSSIYETASGKHLFTLIGHKDYIHSAIFSPNGKYVLTASSDHTARIYDVASGKELQLLSGHTGRVNSSVFSPDGKYAITASDDQTARIYDVASGMELQLLSGHTGGIRSAVFSPDGKYALTASDDQTARIYDVASGKELKLLSGHTGGIRSAVFSPDGKYALTASDDNSARIYDVASGKELQVLGGHSVMLHRVSCRDDKFAFLIRDRKYLNSEVMRVYHKLHFLNKKVYKGEFNVFSSDGRLEFKFRGDRTACIYEALSGNELKIKELCKVESVISAVFSADGKRLFIVTNAGIVLIFDVNTGNQLAAFSMDLQEGIDTAQISSDCKLVLVRTMDEQIRVFELKSKKELYVLGGIMEKFISAVFISDGDRILTISQNDNIASIWDALTGIKLTTFSGYSNRIKNVEFSSDFQLALTMSYDNTVRIWNVQSGKVVSILYEQTQISSAIFSADNRLVITTNYNGSVNYWSVYKSEIILNQIELENDNYLIKLPNSPYYMCSKEASKMLHYVTPSLKVIGFDQLDPVYNRPDIVLDSIGKYFGGSDKDLVANYRAAWEKRIDRLGLDKDKLSTGEIAVPNAEIANANQINYENKDGKLIIHVKANDPKYTLQRYNVLVNEVPLYGSAGISIADKQLQRWEATIDVPLSIGENKIQVSVMNELGLENFKYPTYVNYSPAETVSAKTYYVGIGVNHFQDASHDLKYCVKDVQDLAKAFSKNQTQVETLVFTDREVTKENILALKSYLQTNTTVNDKVIISCSSHGLLDDSLNFYLATHDVDFKNPRQRGLKYDELESLLDGIPARQKLLLLDACNSGENERLFVERNKNSDLASNDPKRKGVELEIANNEVETFKKMNELFVNVRNNTGSVIISAAGGLQSALEAIEIEGKVIENGAFTFSVLEYLSKEFNDQERCTVNGMKNYVERRVEEITEGKQKPTSRQETMEVDWVVR